MTGLKKKREDFQKMFWNVLHHVASGYPVTKYMPDAQKDEHAKEYRAFLTIAQHVIPVPELQTAYQYALKQDGLDKDRTFKELNDSSSPRKALAEKVFRMHDTAAEYMKHTWRTNSYETLFNKYNLHSSAKANNRNNNVNTSYLYDGAGVIRLQKELEVRNAPMDEYLSTVIPGYDAMRPSAKASIRAKYYRQAAEWWWNELVVPYAKQPRSQRSTLVLAEFKRRFQRVRSVPRNAFLNIWSKLPSYR